MVAPHIRTATEADAPALLEIYRPFVDSSAVSFEVAVPTVEDFAARIAKAVAGWQWLVAVRDGQRVGYAYGSAHRERLRVPMVDQRSPPTCTRTAAAKGIGRVLYLRLFDELAGKGYCNAYAGHNPAQCGQRRPALQRRIRTRRRLQGMSAASSASGTTSGGFSGSSATHRPRNELTNFAVFLETAWNDHGDRPQEVADRLLASLSLVEAPDKRSRRSRDWQHTFSASTSANGITVSSSWNRCAACPRSIGSAAVDSALTRSVANVALRERRGFHFGDAHRGNPRRGAGNGRFCFRGAPGIQPRRCRATRRPFALRMPGLPAKAPAIRALAVGGNNLAAALEEKADRDAAETEAMVAAANGALRYWKEAGTWLEEERAEYRLARSPPASWRRPWSAIQSAWRCVDSVQAQ